MATVNFYIGLNDKDLHKQVKSTVLLKQIIIETMSMYYNNYTIENCMGYYKRESENSFKVSIMFEHYKDIDASIVSKCGRALRDYLNQECVMVETIKDSIISFI